MRTFASAGSLALILAFHAPLLGQDHSPCPHGPSSVYHEHPAAVFPVEADELRDMVEETLRADDYAMQDSGDELRLATAPNFSWPDLTRPQAWLGDVHPGVALDIALVPLGESTRLEASSRVACRLPEEIEVEEVFAWMATGHLMVMVAERITGRRPPNKR